MKLCTSCPSVRILCTNQTDFPLKLLQQQVTPTYLSASWQQQLQPPSVCPYRCPGLLPLQLDQSNLHQGACPGSTCSHRTANREGEQTEAVKLLKYRQKLINLIWLWHRFTPCAKIKACESKRGNETRHKASFAKTFCTRSLSLSIYLSPSVSIRLCLCECLIGVATVARARLVGRKADMAMIITR